MRDVSLVPQAPRPGARPAGSTCSTRASPEIVSAEIGLRLWGIADDPFWPGLKPSRTSLTSVRCRCRSSTATASHVAPTAAQAQRNSAWRSRATTCVAGTGRQAERATDVCLDFGRDVRVRADRAAELHHRQRLASADVSRDRSRSTCSAHSATLAPNVVGSAWMPWVLPIITVSRWARARSTSVRSNSVDAAISSVGGVAHRPAQRRVDDVGRRQPVVDPRCLPDRRCRPARRRRTRPRRDP